MPYSLREALSAFRRTPLLTFLSVVAISLSLFVVGLFALTTFNIRRQIENIEERVEVVAFLRDDATPEEIQLARHDLQGMPEVRQIQYLSREDALVKAVQDLKEFREVFVDQDVNPLPASLEIRLRPGHRTPADLERVATRLGGYRFVEDVRFGRDWVGKIVALRRIAAGASAIIGGAFALVAGIIIATAVRISVFARREEIHIMRLVGATDAFIERPFLFEGLLAGIFGGLVAAGLTFAAFRVVSVTLFDLEWLPPTWALLGVAAGALYGLLSSALAIRLHLRAV
jgi:cell division transport system permease protein